MPSCKISWRKNVNSWDLIYNIVSLGNMAGNLFHEDKLNMNL